MRIIFVIGIMGAGKSTYIKNNFKDAKVIDLYDFQIDKKSTYNDIWQSYLECKDALVNAINDKYEVIVMEHTLLKAERRAMYINAVKEITDNPIEAIVINPDLDILRERWKERDMYIDDEDILNVLNVLEIPTIKEGFNSVTIIN